MVNQSDQLQRAILPIPERPFAGGFTYDAKDPTTSFPPIEPPRPPPAPRQTTCPGRGAIRIHTG